MDRGVGWRVNVEEEAIFGTRRVVWGVSSSETDFTVLVRQDVIQYDNLMLIALHPDRSFISSCLLGLPAESQQQTEGLAVVRIAGFPLVARHIESPAIVLSRSAVAGRRIGCR